MDHLPVPSNPNFPTIKVPYLCQEDYDGGPLSEYPQRQGWTVAITAKDMEILNLGNEPTVVETSAFLQTWLYFGLLCETVGPRYRKVSFSRIEGDAKYLTTANLWKVIEEWSLELASQESLGNLDCLTQRMKCVWENVLLVQDVTYAIGSCKPEVLHQNFVLDLAVLAEALSQVLRDIGIIDSVAEIINIHAHLMRCWRKITRSGRYDAGLPLIQPLTALGWCPVDVKRIDATVDKIGTLYYLANMKPPRASSDHESCLESFCLSTKIQPSTYKLTHALPSCECPVIRADNNELCEIVLNGRLAILDIKENGQSPPETVLSMRARKEHEDFVAISHVWSEGLGNPVENGLHACELKRIANLTRECCYLGDESTPMTPIPFWLDSMSVPIRPRHAQQLALSRMREPYEQAKYVLVLDAYLLEASASRIDEMEIFARILCSSWMQRLWTLQEARLGKKVLFQFAEKAIDLEKLFYSISFQRIPTKMYRATQLDLIFSYQASRYCREIGEFNGDIVSTRRNLKSRSVSVASDEALCLACLMNQDVSQVVHADADDRMAVFWKMQATVPAGMIFSRATQKLQVPGLAWAPKSFLGFTKQTVEEDTWFGPNYLTGIKAPVSDNGLLVKLPGLMLYPKIHDINDYTDPFVAGYKRIESYSSLLLRNTSNELWYVIKQNGQSWTNRNTALDDRSRRAFILQDSLRLDTELMKQHTIHSQALDTLRFSMVRVTLGIKVMINDRKLKGDQHVVYVNGLRHIELFLLDEGCQRALNIALRGAQELLAEKRLPRWIISEDLIEECKVKAKELLEDPEIELIYRNWAMFFGDDYDPILLTSFISNFGAAVDLLEFEPTADDQSCPSPKNKTLYDQQQQGISENPLLVD